MTPPWPTAGDSIPITSIPWDSSWPVYVPEPERRLVLGYFEQRFGIPLSTYADYLLFKRSKTYMVLRYTPHLTAVATLKVYTVGLPVLRQVGRYCKPTTAALQTFGHLATRNVVELSTAQLERLLRHRILPLSLALTPGYVMLRAAGHILGCGLYTAGRLLSQLPQRQVRQLRLDEDEETL